MAETADSYNIEQYTWAASEASRQAFPDLPLRVGTRAPGFELPTTDGQTVSLDQLRSNGPVALLFSCYTALPLLTELPGLEQGYRGLRSQGVSFVLIYTREIHPGSLFPPHRTLEQKTAQARRLVEETGITFPVAVDALDGTVHLTYGGLPSMAYLVERDGRIAYRAQWTVADHLLAALRNLLLRDQGGSVSPGYVEMLNLRPRETRAEWEAFLPKCGAGALEDWEHSQATERGGKLP